MEQRFNVAVADTAASLLALCVGSLIIPTAFHSMLSSLMTALDLSANPPKLSRICLSVVSHRSALERLYLEAE